MEIVASLLHHNLSVALLTLEEAQLYSMLSILDAENGGLLEAVVLQAWRVVLTPELLPS